MVLEVFWCFWVLGLRGFSVIRVLELVLGCLFGFGLLDLSAFGLESRVDFWFALIFWLCWVLILRV